MHPWRQVRVEPSAQTIYQRFEALLFVMYGWKANRPMSRCQRKYVSAQDCDDIFERSWTPFCRE